eukprot:7376060-Prymnesium_polylepis.1
MHPSPPAGPALPRAATDGSGDAAHPSSAPRPDASDRVVPKPPQPRPGSGAPGSSAPGSGAPESSTAVA